MLLYAKLHGKKAISGVQNCTEKKRSQVCKEEKMLIKCIKHINLVMHHKWLVFKLCCKVGLPWRGFMHDWSKFSPTEFWESVKYFDGHKSPITVCKKDKGYSEAWLHHKGRNKHHYQYWTDLSLPEKTVIMPYRYAVEMVCDELAAGITYNGKNWTKDTQLEYYINKERKNLREVLKNITEYGIIISLHKLNTRIVSAGCVYAFGKNADSTLASGLNGSWSIVCVATNGALRFSCVVPFGAAHFLFRRITK